MEETNTGADADGEKTLRQAGRRAQATRQRSAHLRRRARELVARSRAQRQRMEAVLARWQQGRRREG
ncbi:hypothetical protein [Streptomyces sp. NPDC016845]|uniref:hypothetical protein n=1 Tax=Streptomyces sp. NPDC016845 TaxID=3364972 RepID=UPI0037BC76C6